MCLGTEPAKCSVLLIFTVQESEHYSPGNYTYHRHTSGGRGAFLLHSEGCTTWEVVNTPNLKGLHYINHFPTRVEVVYPD